MAEEFSRFQGFVPSRQVFDCEIQTAVGRRVHTRRDPFLIFENALNQPVASRTIRDDVGLRDNTRLVHAERIEYVFLEKIAVEFPRDFMDQDAERHVAKVAVSPFFSRSEAQRLRLDHFQQLVLGIILLQGKALWIIPEARRVR